MKKSKSTRVGVERGFGPRHAFNAQEGSEAVPEELPSPPRDARLNYGGQALKWLAKEVQGVVLPDEAIDEIKRNPMGPRALEAYANAAIMLSRGAGGKGAGELPRGAVPHTIWSDWKSVSMPPGSGEMRVDNAGNHFQKIGSHEAGGQHHVIVQPVEEPPPGRTDKEIISENLFSADKLGLGPEKPGKLHVLPDTGGLGTGKPIDEQFPSLNKPPYDALKEPSTGFTKLKGSQEPPLEIPPNEWPSGFPTFEEFYQGQPQKMSHPKAREDYEAHIEWLKRQMRGEPQSSKPMSPEEEKYWMEGEQPPEPNVPRFKRGKSSINSTGVRHNPKTKTGRPKKIGVEKGYGPRHAENSKEGEDLTEINTDTVPAMLTPREAVMNRNAAELLGRGKIEKLNAEGNALAKKGVDLAGGNKEVARLWGGSDDIPPWEEPTDIPGTDQPDYPGGGVGGGDNPHIINENPFYASQHQSPYAWQSIESMNRLGWDPSRPTYGFGSGEPSRRGIDQGLNVVGNATGIPGLGWGLGKLGRGLWHLYQNWQMQHQGGGGDTGGTGTSDSGDGGTGTTPIDTSGGGAGRGDRWHDIFGPRWSASGTPGVGVGISPTGQPAVGREWWSPDFGRYDLGASGQGAGNYNLAGPGGWAIGSRGTGFGNQTVGNWATAIGFDRLGAGSGPSNLSWGRIGMEGQDRPHFNPFFGGYSADKMAGGPSVKLRAKGDADVQYNRGGKNMKTKSKQSKPKSGSPYVQGFEKAQGYEGGTDDIRRFIRKPGENAGDPMTWAPNPAFQGPTAPKPVGYVQRPGDAPGYQNVNKYGDVYGWNPGGTMPTGGAPPPVGSEAWIRTHPNYKPPVAPPVTPPAAQPQGYTNFDKWGNPYGWNPGGADQVPGGQPNLGKRFTEPPGGYNRYGGGGFYPPGQGVFHGQTGTSQVGIGDPDPQAIGANFGAPPQLSAPDLGPLVAAITKEAQKQGLNASQIQSILGAFKGIGGGSGLEVGAGTGNMDAVGAFQGGISDIGYPPFIAPNAQYHADKGSSWIGPYDPKYMLPAYQRGTAWVPGW